jgi:hypothetical protein
VKLPRWVSIAWVVSTVIGFVGYFAPGLDFLFVVSGVLFGVSFAHAGLKGLDRLMDILLQCNI